MLLDYVDFVVHIFSERARQYYDLERLWKTAKRLQPSDLKKSPVAAKKARAKKVAPKKAAAKKPAVKKAVAKKSGAKASAKPAPRQKK